MMGADAVKKKIEHFQQTLSKPFPWIKQGTITRAVGLTLEAKGVQVPVGNLCHVLAPDKKVLAVVTGFNDKKLFLMPLENISNLAPGCGLVPTDKILEAPVGPSLLGRVIDGAGAPLDNQGPLNPLEYRPLGGMAMNPLLRKSIRKPLDVGIRAINGLLTIGLGQRIGLFAGSGLGKSVLLGMMACYTKADVVVVGLVGERGREVQDFLENNLGSAGLQRAVVVASPADYSPVARLNGGLMAMTIAEYFRDQGKHVLLLMDSLTRMAQAQREIALSMGEPPATKGYPPSAFAILPKLVERAGYASQDKEGSITAIFTVLAEGDDQLDPVVDATRAILDGHIVLSREYAELGHYPAIDVEASVSRVMSSVVEKNHAQWALKFKRWHALYRENKDMINMGVYTRGINQELDLSVQKNDEMNGFLQQSKSEQVDLEDTLRHLNEVVEIKHTDVTV